MLKLIYTLFLGLILAVFIGVGVSVFYPEPKPPEAPVFFEKAAGAQTAEEKQQQEAFAKEQTAYQKALSPYNRNASIITLAGALLFLIIGLAGAKQLDMLADGILLGSVFTLLYSIGRGLASQDITYRFTIVSVALLVALVLGYIKFVRPQKAAK